MAHINQQKSDYQRAKDEMIAKHKRQRRNTLYYKRFYREVELKGNLLNPDFIKNRYKDLAPKKKIIAKKEDFLKYGEPVTLIKKEVLGLIKYKLKESVDQALEEFIDDTVAVKKGLSPQKEYKQSKYVSVITEQIKQLMTKEWANKNLSGETEPIQESGSSSLDLTNEEIENQIDSLKLDLSLIPSEEATRLRIET